MRASDIIRRSIMEKLAAFKIQTDPKLKTRISPFRKDITAKAKVPYKIEAPSITPPSKGKTDEGHIQ